MLAELREREGEVRGVRVRLAEAVVGGHVVEQVIVYDVAEAEAAHSQPFGEDVDSSMQSGLGHADRVALDETWGWAIRAPAWVLDGKCVRTYKVAHCDDVKPASAFWEITHPDGTKLERPPWSCVGGEPPVDHDELLRQTRAAALQERLQRRRSRRADG